MYWVQISAVGSEISIVCSKCNPPVCIGKHLWCEMAAALAAHMLKPVYIFQANTCPQPHDHASCCSADTCILVVSSSWLLLILRGTRSHDERGFGLTRHEGHDLGLGAWIVPPVQTDRDVVCRDYSVHVHVCTHACMHACMHVCVTPDPRRYWRNYKNPWKRLGG